MLNATELVIEVESRKFTNLDFRKVITHKGNFLIRMLYTEGEKNSTLLYYVNAKGDERFVSPAELTNTPAHVAKGDPSPYLTYASWTRAKNTWTVKKSSYPDSLLLPAEKGLSFSAMIPVKEQKLTDEEIQAAMKVAKAILKDPLHGFPNDIVTKTRNKVYVKEVKKEAQPAANFKGKSLEVLQGIAKLLPA